MRLLFPNLAGEWIFRMPLIATQKVKVKGFGNYFSLQLKDRFDRERTYESRYVGFGVTEFRPRYSSFARIVVHNDWEAAFFIDEGGLMHAIEVRDGH